MDFTDLYYARGRVEFDRAEVAPGESIEFSFVFRNISRDTKHLTIRLFLPEGWTADRESLHLSLHPKGDGGRSMVFAKITVGERMEGKNIIYALVSADCRPSVAMLPIVIWGK